MTSNGHFDEMTGLLYLEGQLDAGRAAKSPRTCTPARLCRELLHALETESVWLREALTAEEESIPARVIAAPSRIEPLGLVDCLWAVGRRLHLWSGFVEPWLAQASQAGFTQGNLLTVLFFTGAFWKGWDTMRSLMEFLAVGDTGMVAIWLLRKQWRRFTAIAFVMGAFALVAGASRSLWRRNGMQVPIQDVDTRQSRLHARRRTGGEDRPDRGRRAHADRRRRGRRSDRCFQSLTVNGHVKGDILGFGQEVRVNGPVDGNVRLWCQRSR